MPDAAPEIVYTGTAKPSSWERAGRFIKEKVIDPHTPEAHYQDIMQKYFWVTDRLEGQSLELSQSIRPQVELAARAAGWSKTLVEGFIVGQAAAFMMFLGYRGFKSAAEVFGGMARRHGGKLAGEATMVAAGAAVSSVGNRDDRQGQHELLLLKDAGTIGETLLTDDRSVYAHLYDKHKYLKNLFSDKEKLLSVLDELRGLPLTAEEYRLIPVYQSMKDPSTRREHLSLIVSRAYDRLYPEKNQNDPSYVVEKSRMLEAIDALEFFRQESWVNEPIPRRKNFRRVHLPAADGNFDEKERTTSDQVEMIERPSGRQRGWKLEGRLTYPPSKSIIPPQGNLKVEQPKVMQQEDTPPHSSISLALSKNVFIPRSVEGLKTQYGAMFHRVIASVNGDAPWTNDEFFNTWQACVNARGQAQHDLRHAVLPTKDDDQRGKYMDRLYDYAVRPGGSVVDPDRKISFLNILAQIDTLSLEYK